MQRNGKRERERERETESDKEKEYERDGDFCPTWKMSAVAVVT